MTAISAHTAKARCGPHAPQLAVAHRSTAAVDAPAAWITFRTAKVGDPRLVVVRVQGASGRSFRGAPGRTCLRSTIVTEDGRISITPGHRYRVDFYSRAGIGSTRPKVLIATRTLRASSFAIGSRLRAPRCAG